MAPNNSPKVQCAEYRIVQECAKVPPPLREKKTEDVHYAIIYTLLRLGHLLGATFILPIQTHLTLAKL